MDADILAFFEGHPQALALYQALEERIFCEIDGVSVKAQKTQISFFNRRMFACASFAKVRRAKERPADYLTVTFGLGRRVASDRIDGVVEPYSNRWTHHVLLSEPAEIDETLMAWIREAAHLSESKR